MRKAPYYFWMNQRLDQKISNKTEITHSNQILTQQTPTWSYSNIKYSENNIFSFDAKIEYKNLLKLKFIAIPRFWALDPPIPTASIKNIIFLGYSVNKGKNKYTLNTHQPIVDACKVCGWIKSILVNTTQHYLNPPLYEPFLRLYLQYNIALTFYYATDFNYMLLIYKIIKNNNQLQCIKIIEMTFDVDGPSEAFFSHDACCVYMLTRRGNIMKIDLMSWPQINYTEFRQMYDLNISYNK